MAIVHPPPDQAARFALNLDVVQRQDRWLAARSYPASRVEYGIDKEAGSEMREGRRGATNRPEHVDPYQDVMSMPTVTRGCTLSTKISFIASKYLVVKSGRSL